jgi:T4-like virus Myoviridae tail sheath stabiliser
MRIFSDIKIRNGPDANGLYTIQRVPILYGDPSWMVAQLIKGGSENTLMPSPIFSAWIDSIHITPKRRQDTQYVGKLSTVEREFTGGAYTNQPGVRQDVERYMPVPYDITFKLDLWTTNVNTKLQIVEQILYIFNPSIQLQQNSNILDWTSIMEVWFEDYTWTNRSIPQGGEDVRDVTSFKFKVEAWINPPAKLKRSGLIAEIVTRMYNTADVDVIRDHIDKEYDPFSCFGGIPIQIVTTEGNYKISVAREGNTETITLLDAYGQADPTLSWFDLIQKYGQITPNITKIRLKLDPDLDVVDSDIIGGIEQDPNRQNVLFFTADQDTSPPNTILPIAGIIDPAEVWPGHGLPIAIPGQRYLLTSSTSAGEEPVIPPNVPTSPWGQFLIAYPNDIIEYNGISWAVIFDSKNSTGKNYVVNNENGSQYQYDSATGEWSYTYLGVYEGGYWRIDNIISAPDGTVYNNYE